MKTEQEVRRIFERMKTIESEPCTCRDLIGKLRCQAISQSRRLMMDVLACILGEESLLEGELDEINRCANAVIGRRKLN